MICVQIALLVAGIAILITGKASLGTGRKLGDERAGSVGCLLMLPLPLTFVLGFLAGFARAKGTISWSQDELMANLFFVDIAVTAACVLLATLFFFGRAEPDSGRSTFAPPAPPVRKPQSNFGAWTKPADTAEVVYDLDPDTPAPPAGPATRSPVASPPGAPPVRRPGGGVRTWVACVGVALGLLTGCLAGSVAGATAYWLFVAVPNSARTRQMVEAKEAAEARVAVRAEEARVAKAGADQARADAEQARVAETRALAAAAEARAAKGRAEAKADTASTAEADAAARATSATREVAELRQKEQAARVEAAAARQTAELQRYLNQLTSASRYEERGLMMQAEEALRRCSRDVRCREWNLLLHTCRGESTPLSVGPVRRLLLDRGGRRLATQPDADNVVRVFDLATGVLVYSSPANRRVTSVALSPDGRLLALAGEQSAVLDLQTGQPSPDFKGPALTGQHVLFCSDGRQIACLTSAPPFLEATIREVASGNTVRSWKVRAEAGPDPAPGSTGPVPEPATAAAVSPDGRRLAVSFTRVRDGQGRGRVVVCDVGTGENVRELPDRFGPVAFSPDGNRVAASGPNGTVTITDATSGKELLSVRTPPADDLAFHPDGTRFAAASRQDGGVRSWSATDGRALGLFAGKHDAEPHVAFTPDGRLVAAGKWSPVSDEVEVRVWPTADPPGLRRLRENVTRVHALAFSPDGRRLASAHADGSVRVWDAGKSLPLLTLKGHGDTPRDVCWSPDGTQLASAGCREDGEQPRVGEIRIWNAGTGDAVRSLTGHAFPARHIAWSADGNTLAAGGWPRLGRNPTGPGEANVRLWNARSGHPQERVHVQGNLVGLAFNPGKDALVTVGSGGQVTTWARPFGSSASMIRMPGLQLQDMALDARGNRIGILDSRGTAFVLELRDGGKRMELRLPGTPINAVTFTPDGRRAVTGGKDGSVRFWAAATGDEILSLQCHKGPVTCIAFSPDGTRLATGALGASGKEAEILIWETEP